MKNTFLNNSKTTDKMCLVLKTATMPGLKKRIYMHREPVKITADSVMLQYHLDNQLRFMTWYKGEEGAITLQERGIITRFEGIGSNLKMYRKKICTWPGRDGTPLMLETEIEFEWEDMHDLLGFELIDIVANWEYEITGRIAGFIPYKPKARVRDMEPRQYNWGTGGSQVITLKVA